MLIKKLENGLIFAQIYIDNIIFESPIESHAIKFAKLMKNEFEMSMVGELNYFLRLQIKKMQ